MGSSRKIRQQDAGVRRRIGQRAFGGREADISRFGDRKLDLAGLVVTD
jgi:hypothetical protein